MYKEIFLAETYITIKYDAIENILYADWTGKQTQESIMSGCESILHYLKQKQCTRVLNDSTCAVNVWLTASWWVAVDWFPRMQEAGCELFAWVDSQNACCSLSIEETLKFGIIGVIALTFSSKESAQEWLSGYDLLLSDSVA